MKRILLLVESYDVNVLSDDEMEVLVYVYDMHEPLDTVLNMIPDYDHVVVIGTDIPEELLDADIDFGILVDESEYNALVAQELVALVLYLISINAQPVCLH